LRTYRKLRLCQNGPLFASDKRLERDHIFFSRQNRRTRRWKLVRGVRALLIDEIGAGERSCRGLRGPPRIEAYARAGFPPSVVLEEMRCSALLDSVVGSEVAIALALCPARPLRCPGKLVAVLRHEWGSHPSTSGCASDQCPHQRLGGKQAPWRGWEPSACVP
jgi:hypothetical protein